MSKLIRHALALAVGATILGAHAADAPPVEAFFKDPDVTSAALSPSGRYVMILSRVPDGKQVLAIRETADLSKVTVAGSFDTSRVHGVHWINDNRLGITLKQPKLDFIGNLDELAVDRDGSNALHLIAGNWDHQQQSIGSNLKSRTLTADYFYYRATHDGSDDIIVEKYSWNNIDKQPESSRLYRLNTRTRVLKDLLPGGQPANVKRWVLDADSQPRIAISEVKGRCIVSYREANAGEWSEISNRDCYTEAGFTPVFFDNRNTLFVRAPNKGREALYEYDLNKRALASEPFVDIEGFDYSGSVEQDYVARKILGVHVVSDAKGTVWLDPGMKAIQKQVDALLPQTINHITCGEDCAKPRAILVRSESDRQPTSWYVVTPADGKIVGLGGTHPDIKPAQMGRRDFYRFAARDGLQIPVYVTMPPGKPSGKLPTVVLVHGGPYVRGGSWEWDDEAQFLASRGYVVLQPEFRGSTGFGYRHFQAGWKQWGRAMQDDLVDATAWAVSKGWSDPKRVALMGASYGGYATLMGLIRDPEVFRCGVEWAGVSDIDLLFSAVQSDLSEDARRYRLPTLIGDPKEDAAQFAQYSPLQRAAELRQPLLMAHGGQDVRVPVIHATRFRSAAAKNRNIELVSYPEEGHGWRLEETRLDFWKRVEAFLAKNL
jgi:dienelactone hydrolase